METWIIWALISVIAWWLYHFTNKMVAERNYNTHLVNILGYIVSSVMMLIFVLFQWTYWLTFPMFLFILLLALWNVVFYSTSIITRVESMKNIDTVIFYPVYKTIWPILVTLISLFVFKESLVWKEILWILVWICVPLLLINKKENIIQKNLLLGVVLIFVTAVLSAISSIMPKIAQVQNLNIDMFLLITFSLGIIFSYVWFKWEKKMKNKIYNSEGILKFGIIAWILNTLAFYSFTRALEWNLAIVFTINSFAILIPIILSIIFYWEHFNLKKWIVILLSIVSILLFI